MSKTTDDDHNKLTRYIHTYTGVVVEEAGGTGVPTVLDIAVHCGRITRFAGATVVWWPVLLHLFVVQRIVADMYSGGVVEQFEALFHDAHEAITCDVPSPFKPASMSAYQRELDARMRAYYRIPEPDVTVHALVKKADTVALLAEAVLIGPGDGQWAKERGVSPQAVQIVQEVLNRYPGFADTLEPTGEAVQDYIMLFETLLEEIRG